ncbi:MAG: type II toxin-antitoxin system VapC family toxin [Propionibacteriaceae bacterium]|nr:type II toxin-antitoxin system VapC family toxin [Propionibacteriaceae bacterium]
MSLADTQTAGLLDTCVVIDLAQYDSADLPDIAHVSAITLAELSYGVALAKSPVDAATRSQAFANIKTWITPLPFDGTAAERYGELAALIVTAGRQPRPRRLDLMIAAIAVVRRLPLYTANADDFAGLESVLQIIPVRPSGANH